MQRHWLIDPRLPLHDRLHLRVHRFAFALLIVARATLALELVLTELKERRRVVNATAARRQNARRVSIRGNSSRGGLMIIGSGTFCRI